MDPVPFYVKNDLTGLGKMNQDVEMIESTVSQRRNLDSERLLRETEEQRRAREVSFALSLLVEDIYLLPAASPDIGYSRATRRHQNRTGIDIATVLL